MEINIAVFAKNVKPALKTFIETAPALTVSLLLQQ